jgi:hypothetical protein
MRVNVDVGELVHCSHTQWMDRPPQRCTRGHWLLPGHMIVTTIPCCGGPHICWECECGAATYGPALTESCSVVTGSARIRWPDPV